MIVFLGSIWILYPISIHFSFTTALIILGCRTRLAVTETPFVAASDNGMAFSFCQIGSYCRIGGESSRERVYPRLFELFALFKEPGEIKKSLAKLSANTTLKNTYCCTLTKSFLCTLLSYYSVPTRLQISGVLSAEPVNVSASKGWLEAQSARSNAQQYVWSFWRR